VLFGLGEVFMGTNNSIIISLGKKIDAENSDMVLRDLTNKILGTDIEECILDAGNLDYISSAGLRVLLSIKKKFKGNLVIDNVSNNVYEIFDVTGFNQLLNIKKKKRSVSVDGCEIIGRGFYGTVYRIDPETIIKVYENAPDNILDLIENEKNMAKLALVNGIPTAISYDIVKVGECYGSVFELLNARTFNDLVIDSPDEVDDITTKYVEFLKLIHSTEIDDPMLPSARSKFTAYLDEIGDYFDPALKSKLMELIMTVRDSRNVVHGDPQMKNIMMVSGEPMLIDMDTLCAGEAIFDLQAIFVTYIAFQEDDPDNSMRFLGISNETALHIWDKILKLYFNEKTDEERNIFCDKIKILAYLRFIYIIVTSDMKNSELGRLRIKNALAKLKALTDNYDNLVI